MGKPKRRFVARAVAGIGWLIWDKRNGGGERYANCPASLLKKLNGGKRPEQIVRSENVLADADLKKV